MTKTFCDVKVCIVCASLGFRLSIRRPFVCFASGTGFRQNIFQRDCHDFFDTKVPSGLVQKSLGGRCDSLRLNRKNYEPRSSKAAGTCFNLPKKLYACYRPCRSHGALPHEASHVKLVVGTRSKRKGKTYFFLQLLLWKFICWRDPQPEKFSFFNSNIWQSSLDISKSSEKSQVSNPSLGFSRGLCPREKPFSFPSGGHPDGHLMRLMPSHHTRSPKHTVARTSWFVNLTKFSRTTVGVSVEQILPHGQSPWEKPLSRKYVSFMNSTLQLSANVLLRVSSIKAWDSPLAQDPIKGKSFSKKQTESTVPWIKLPFTNINLIRKEENFFSHRKSFFSYWLLPFFSFVSYMSNPQDMHKVSRQSFLTFFSNEEPPTVVRTAISSPFGWGSNTTQSDDPHTTFLFQPRNDTKTFGCFDETSQAFKGKHLSDYQSMPFFYQLLANQISDSNSNFKSTESPVGIRALILFNLYKRAFLNWNWQIWKLRSSGVFQLRQTVKKKVNLQAPLLTQQAGFLKFLFVGFPKHLLKFDNNAIKKDIKLPASLLLISSLPELADNTHKSSFFASLATGSFLNSEAVHKRNFVSVDSTEVIRTPWRKNCRRGEPYTRGALGDSFCLGLNSETAHVPVDARCIQYNDCPRLQPTATKIQPTAARDFSTALFIMDSLRLRQSFRNLTNVTQLFKFFEETYYNVFTGFLNLQNNVEKKVFSTTTAVNIVPTTAPAALVEQEYQKYLYKKKNRVAREILPINGRFLCDLFVNKTWKMNHPLLVGSLPEVYRVNTNLSNSGFYLTVDTMRSAADTSFPKQAIIDSSTRLMDTFVARKNLKTLGLSPRSTQHVCAGVLPSNDIQTDRYAYSLHFKLKKTPGLRKLIAQVTAPDPAVQRLTKLQRQHSCFRHNLGRPRQKIKGAAKQQSLGRPLSNRAGQQRLSKNVGRPFFLLRHFLAAKLSWRSTELRTVMKGPKINLSSTLMLQNRSFMTLKKRLQPYVFDLRSPAPRLFSVFSENGKALSLFDRTKNEGRSFLNITARQKFENQQKRRRMKKQRRETRRRKKRKRFFPRPIWLRFQLYEKFLKKRHLFKFLQVSNQNITNFTGVTSPVGFSYTAKPAILTLRLANNWQQKLFSPLGANAFAILRRVGTENVKLFFFSCYKSIQGIGKQSLLNLSTLEPWKTTFEGLSIFDDENSILKWQQAYLVAKSFWISGARLQENFIYRAETRLPSWVSSKTTSGVLSTTQQKILRDFVLPKTSRQDKRKKKLQARFQHSSKFVTGDSQLKRYLLRSSPYAFIGTQIRSSWALNKTNSFLAASAYKGSVLPGQPQKSRREDSFSKFSLKDIWTREKSRDQLKKNKTKKLFHQVHKKLLNYCQTPQVELDYIIHASQRKNGQIEPPSFVKNKLDRALCLFKNKEEKINYLILPTVSSKTELETIQQQHNPFSFWWLHRAGTTLPASRGLLDSSAFMSAVPFIPLKVANTEMTGTDTVFGKTIVADERGAFKYPIAVSFAFCAALFHICSFFSLLIISQIRCILKFNFLVLYKISGTFSEIFLYFFNSIIENSVILLFSSRKLRQSTFVSPGLEKKRDIVTETRTLEYQATTASLIQSDEGAALTRSTAPRTTSDITKAEQTDLNQHYMYLRTNKNVLSFRNPEVPNQQRRTIFYPSFFYQLSVLYKVYKKTSFFIFYSFVSVVNLFESWLRLFYIFLEKPTEFFDWIALFFLIEWSSDLAPVIPDSLELAFWGYIDKITRYFRFLGPFGYILQKRLWNICEIVLDILHQPDTDLISRQKKGIIFWDLLLQGSLTSLGPDFIFKSGEIPIFITGLDVNTKLNDYEETTDFKKKNTWNSGTKAIGHASVSIERINIMKFSTLSLSLQLPFSTPLLENSNGTPAGQSYAEKYAVVPKIDWRYSDIPVFLWTNEISKARNLIDFDPSIMTPSQQEIQHRFWVYTRNTSLAGFRTTNKWKRWAANQNFTFASKLQPDLFIDTHLPKSFVSTLQSSTVSISDSVPEMKQQSTTILRLVAGSGSPWLQETSASVSQNIILRHGAVEPRLQSTVMDGSTFITASNLICQIYSGIFYKKTAKNVLVIGNEKTDKTLLIQAIAGETELKIITDNANRYTLVLNGLPVGIRLLKEAFDAIALHTPCIFLLEEIHVIGERRSSLMSEDVSPSENLFGSEKEDIHEKHQMLYTFSRHKLSYYRKPKAVSNYTATPNKRIFRRKPPEMMRSFGFTEQPFQVAVRGPAHPLPLSIFSEQPSSVIMDYVHKGLGESRAISYVPGRMLSGPAGEESVESLKVKRTFLELGKKAFLAPPSTSPFTVLVMKELKKFKPKKIVNELPWSGVPMEQLVLLPQLNYSIKAKVLLLVDKAVENLYVKVNMITDLLLIIDSVRSNRGFIVFATTHVPSVLDPALRRPGRFDETISLPFISDKSFSNRWKTTIKFGVDSYSMAQRAVALSSHSYKTLQLSKGLLDLGVYVNKTTHYKVDSRVASISSSVKSGFNLQSAGIFVESVNANRHSKEGTDLIFSSNKYKSKTTLNRSTFKYFSLLRFQTYIKIADILTSQSALRLLFARSKMGQEFQSTLSACLHQTAEPTVFLAESFAYQKKNHHSRNIKSVKNSVLLQQIAPFFLSQYDHLYSLAADIYQHKYSVVRGSKPLQKQSELLPWSTSFIDHGTNKGTTQRKKDLLQTARSVLLDAAATSISSALSGLIVLRNNMSLEEPSSAPFSRITLPSHRFENYKRAEKDSQRKVFFSIQEKTHLHQNKKRMQRFYGLIQKKTSSSSSRFENQITSNLDQYSSPPVSTNWFYKKKILNRHRLHLINQWSNGQLGEHNKETTFASDVDWRIVDPVFYDLKDQRSLLRFFVSVDKLPVLPSKLCLSALNFGNYRNNEELTVVIDFPDSDQFYNPKQRRWMLTKGYWSYWFDFEMPQKKEIFIDPANRRYSEKPLSNYNKKREQIDYLGYKFLQKGVLKELDSIV